MKKTMQKQALLPLLSKEDQMQTEVLLSWQQQTQ